MVAFIKDTIGTDINLRLAIDVPQILCNLKNYGTGDVCDSNDNMISQWHLILLLN